MLSKRDPYKAFQQAYEQRRYVSCIYYNNGYKPQAEEEEDYVSALAQGKLLTIILCYAELNYYAYSITL